MIGNTAIDKPLKTMGKRMPIGAVAIGAVVVYPGPGGGATAKAQQPASIDVMP
jgi:hypothetical protein